MPPTVSPSAAFCSVGRHHEAIRQTFKLQFIGLLSDGRSGLCVTLIRLPPHSLVGTFPRGEGKVFMFFVI